jgi:hypothetical protein
MNAEKQSADSTLTLAERAAQLEQIGQRFSELVTMKRAELAAAEPTLDEATLNERAAAAAGEQLAIERQNRQG